jgi:hypothetical protein
MYWNSTVSEISSVNASKFFTATVVYKGSWVYRRPVHSYKGTHSWLISDVNCLIICPSNGATAQTGPWPPLLRFHNNNVLRCEFVSLTTNFGGPMIFLLEFTPVAKGSSFKALKTRSPSHCHLLHNPLCIAPGPPRGG